MPKIEIQSNDLAEAIKSLIPRKKKAKKPVPILFVKEGRGELTVYDAKYQSKGIVLKCKGTLKDSFELDGTMLRSLTEKYPPDVTLILDVSKTKVSIKNAGSAINIPRLDKDGKKTNKVIVKSVKPQHDPEPKEKRAEFDDTWGFSARVPMPASAVKKDD